MTFGQIKTDVRRRLGDSTSAFFTDADIAESVQAGYAELADAAEFYERHANINMIAGHTYYNLLNILPDTFLSPRRIYNNTLARWLVPTDAGQMDRNGWRQWELIYGPPEKMLMRGNWWLGVWPRTSDDTPILRMYYTGIPAEFSDNTDVPAFPVEFHPGIPAFALSDLFSQQRETKKALEKWQEYIGYQDGLAAYVNGRTKLAALSIAGGA